MSIAVLSPTTVGTAAKNSATSSTTTSRVSTETATESESTNSSVSDVVTLSPQARAVLAGTVSATTNGLSQYFPQRDNSEGATVLANGVTSSQQAKDLAAGVDKKPFQQVALDARASMDSKLAAMQASGQPFDPDSSEGRDWYTLMGDLDRRSLYAVRSNEGGLFSEGEQQIALSIMSQQQGLAMGLYTGPTRLEGTFVDQFRGNNPARMEAGMAFLDSVSDEEKSSVEWAAARASVQIGYEFSTDSSNGGPENHDSSDPLVRLIVSAMRTMKDDFQRGWTIGTLQTADDLKNQPWFKGFEGQLDQLLASRADTKATLASDSTQPAS